MLKNELRGWARSGTKADMRISPEDPSWTAPRGDTDWLDHDVLLATTWLATLADQRTWGKRVTATRSYFFASKERWIKGEKIPLYDQRDTAAWYIFQANAYASDRMNWVPEEAVRIVTTFTRIGQELATLIGIPGAEERAARLMNAERAQPDGGLFELLVALSYRRSGWDTEFVPERPGISRTHDINVRQRNEEWAVECKRMNRSNFEVSERERGRALALPVHAIASSVNRSIIMQVAFNSELESLPHNYLVGRASAYLLDSAVNSWVDASSIGSIREVDWSLFRRVLDDDYVYYGSSRMVELLVGRYDHDSAYSMAAEWRAAEACPFWASAVSQASVVGWRNCSVEAIRKKARHFRSTIASAADQLPKDRPGVIHVGVESWGGGDVDDKRHLLNLRQLDDFNPGDTPLLWVYGEYIAPEVTTRSDESWAIEETSVPYRVGTHRTPEPLPGHMLLTPESNIKHGVHWDATTQRPRKREI